ncbi:cbb3-type cytochrome oxidase subunit 3 [Azonexus sp. IMCC34839]|uniref:cbb3-type cytochrome oxidase subunit 3 n=1 Tax=Azonexus sp. IMCC34839 TaxID=3133695 RepID=UPI003999D47C
MELANLLAFYTVAAFLGFLSICAWAFSEYRRQAFDEAAQLPFTDPEEQARRRKALILGR